MIALTKNWVDFSLDHPGTMKPEHISVLFFVIDTHYRREQPSIISLYPHLVYECCGLRSNTRLDQIFSDLESWGFLNIVTIPKHQFSYYEINFDHCMDKMKLELNVYGEMP
jgi:hypothetical protein